MIIQTISHVQRKHELMQTAERNFIRLVHENQKEGMIVVEIGCYKGNTTMGYIDIVKKNKGKVFVIDTFEGSPVPENCVGYNEVFANNFDKNIYSNFLKDFEIYENTLTILKGYSFEEINNLPNDCDIIYIDADHIYESCKNDIELSLKKIKKGGIISGHDLETFDYVNTYSEYELKQDCIHKPDKNGPGHHPGVSQAVYEKFGITNLYGNVWWTIVK